MHFNKTAFPPLVKGVAFRPGDFLAAAMTKQIKRIMRLTAIILLSASMMASAKGSTQGVSLSLKNASLEKVFKEIKKQTGYSFMYTETMLKEAKPVSIEVRNTNMEQVLQLCFANQPFTYEIVEKTIVLKPLEKKGDGHSGLDPESFSQLPPPVDITGKVTDADGNPLVGASVKVKGSSKGTTTNSDGVFTLKGVSDDAVLEISYVGYEVLNLPVNSRSFITTSLKQKPESLNEVVINKGYYSEKQRTSTSNVYSVKEKDIEVQPVSNVLLALVGRVPGMTIQQQSGFANSGIVVRLQGTNSIAGGLEPLYVIDGVPYMSQPLPTTAPASNVLGGINGGLGPAIAGNPLGLIDPSNIESIDVLKDADATAIYGSRGANGVILITTKKGRSGQTRVNVNFRTGRGKVVKRLPLLTTSQYLELRKEGYMKDGVPIPDQTTTPDNSNYDLTVWDPKRFTNWQNVFFGGTANYTDAQANISGGTANTQFFLSTGYHKETTVFPGDFSDQKGSFQFNISHSSSNQKFKMLASGVYLVDNNRIPAIDFVSTAIQLSPNAPALYNPDGSLNWQQITVGSGKVSTWTNPVAILDNSYQNNANNLIGNLQLSYQLLKRLKVSSRFGYNNQQYNELAINPISAIRPEQRATTLRRASYGNSNGNGWIIEPQATYGLSLGRGNLEALLGTSFQQNSINSQPVFGSGYSSDLLLKNLSAAPTVTAGTAIYALYKYNAAYGRLNYNLKDRYIVNLTARRDGSSRFGSENVFNNFWSVAGGWVFTNEKWMPSKSKFINFGKLRASYGTSGNDQIGDYGFMNLYNPVTSGVGVAYQGITALSPNRHTNPYLQWEETNKLQFGIDLGLFSDRVNLNLNYYHNRSSNLLVKQTLSVITGFTNISENFDGTIENTGWEFALSSINIQKKNFSWSTQFNITIPIHNGQLISFPNLAGSVYANTYTVGKSINDVRVYHYIGVDPATGLYEFQDAKGNPTFSPTTADLIGYRNQTQRLYGGLINSISYKGFQLDFSLQGVKRKALLYWGNSPGSFFSGSSNSGNQPVWILDRWQNSGDISSVQIVSANYTSSALNTTLGNFYNNSDGRSVDASYIRMTNLSFSWQLPINWDAKMHLQHARVFIQGQNLFTITNYKGLDPSTGSSSSEVLPPLQIITIGANVSF